MIIYIFYYIEILKYYRYHVLIYHEKHEAHMPKRDREHDNKKEFINREYKIKIGRFKIAMRFLSYIP